MIYLTLDLNCCLRYSRQSQGFERVSSKIESICWNFEPYGTNWNCNNRLKRYGPYDGPYHFDQMIWSLWKWTVAVNQNRFSIRNSLLYTCVYMVRVLVILMNEPLIFEMNLTFRKKSLHYSQYPKSSEKL